MNKYRVKFYGGDYSARQRAANADGAVFYGEGHANSSGNVAADYAMCVVSTNASAMSIAIARELAQRWGVALDVGGDRDTDIGYGNGVRIGGAGDSNLRRTAMPAVLFEPGFASNPRQAALMESEHGLETVAGILADVIRAKFPGGGLIAFSVGHKGKTSAPNDRGAAWAGSRFTNEAEFAQAYLERAAAMLESASTVAHDPVISPMQPSAPTLAEVRTVLASAQTIIGRYLSGGGTE